MKITILGASGGTGRQLIEQGLARGHQITAFVRDPTRLGPLAERVTVVVGDATRDGSAIAEAVRERDAVVSALGASGFQPHGLIGAAMRTIVPVMESERVRRLVLMAAFGVGDSLRQAPTVPRAFFRTLLKRIYADKQDGEDVVRASRLDWTVVRPTKLNDGPKSGRYRAGESIEIRGVFPSISRADAADFMLGEIEKRAYVRKTVVVTT